MCGAPAASTEWFGRGHGSIVDLQTIVGGTGDFVGAAGALRAEGTFTTANGRESRYRGVVCVD